MNRKRTARRTFREVAKNTTRRPQRCCCPVGTVGASWSLRTRMSYGPVHPGAFTIQRSGLDLTANFARLRHGAVHVHIELARLETRILLIGELGTSGNHPH